MSNQRNLFVANTFETKLPPSLLAFEDKWIAEIRRGITNGGLSPNSYLDLKSALTDLARSNTPAQNKLIASQMTRQQFREIVRQYSPDGLTEASAMCFALPRITGKAKFLILQILMDEFGKGNEQNSHSEMYRKLMKELGLPTDLKFSASPMNEESYAFVNIYHWLTKRAPKIDYYLGSLAYTEMIIPKSFRHFVEACERLGIKESKYFVEHVHVDGQHTKLALAALKSLASDSLLDLPAAIEGARLAKHVGDLAFHAALTSAKLTEAA